MTGTQMNHFFQELFQYGHDSNQQLANAFSDNHDKISGKALKLFNHILNAHQIWNNRIKPRQATFGVWDIHPILECQAIDRTNFEHSLYVLDEFNLNEMVRYNNTKGQAFTNSIRDILFHVINHSTYHRGQIAIEFRESGLEPLITDYIFYKR